jgi:hypothetical protein
VSTLAVELGDGWIPSIDEALLAIHLRPTHAAIRTRLAAAFVDAGPHPTRTSTKTGSTKPTKAAATKRVTSGGSVTADRRAALLAAAVTALDGEPFDERRLWPLVVEALTGAGLDADGPAHGADIVRGLVRADAAVRSLTDDAIRAWFADPDVRTALRVHEADGVTWFDRDAFIDLVATIARLSPRSTATGPVRRRELAIRAQRAGYRVDRWLAASDASASAR